MMMVEVDGFVDICHTFGWPIGENVLREAGEALGESSRVSDIACRFSEQKVVVLLSESNADAAKVLADRVNSKLAMIELFHQARRIPMSASFGVFEVGFSDKPLPLQPENIIDGAKLALKTALARGKRQLELHVETP